MNGKQILQPPVHGRLITLRMDQIPRNLHIPRRREQTRDGHRVGEVAGDLPRVRAQVQGKDVAVVLVFLFHGVGDGDDQGRHVLVAAAPDVGCVAGLGEALEGF
jgi:hypothetical protein